MSRTRSGSAAILGRKQLLVAGTHLLEDVKEALVAPTISGLSGASAQRLGRQAAALDVVQKGRRFRLLVEYVAGKSL